MATTPLGFVHPDTGPLRSRVDLVAVEVDAEPSGPVDGDEVGAVRWVPLGELWDDVAAGRITCGMTLAALLRAQLAGILPAR